MLFLFLLRRIASSALELMYLIVEPYEISSPNSGDESQHSALILGKVKEEQQKETVFVVSQWLTFSKRLQRAESI
jgi:hypothetical protein